MMESSKESCIKSKFRHNESWWLYYNYIQKNFTTEEQEKSCMSARKYRNSSGMTSGVTKERNDLEKYNIKRNFI